MINKPMGYDEAQAVTGGVRLPAGNYSCVITQAEVKQSQRGNNMLCLNIDIAAGDYEGYFFKRYVASGKYGESKWDNSAVFRQIIDGDSVGRFKGLLEMLVETNKLDAVTFPYDENKLVGAKFAGQFRDEEQEYNGKVFTKARIANVYPIDQLEELPILEPKLLSGNKGGFGTNRNIAGFGAPVPADTDIPF